MGKGALLRGRIRLGGGRGGRVGDLRACAGVAIRRGCQDLPCGRATAAAMLKGRGAPGSALGGARMAGSKQLSSHKDGGLPVRGILLEAFYTGSDMHPYIHGGA